MIHRRIPFNRLGADRIKRPYYISTPPSLFKDRINIFFRFLIFHLQTAWLVTGSDVVTVLVPQSIAATANVLSGWVVSNSVSNSRCLSGTMTLIANRAPRMILWIWLNLFTLDLANQRLRASIREDRVNKPWRPIPANRLTAKNAQTLLSVAVPATIALSQLLGGVEESLLMVPLNWVYNDLGGADENFVARNLLNALGLMCFSVGATRVLQGCDPALSSAGLLWIAMTGGCIFTTISLQDLYDLEGDLLRGRRTAPIVLGGTNSRVINAVMVMFWSIVIPAYLQLRRSVLGITLAFGLVIAGRTIRFRSVAADKATFQVWCVWMAMLYTLPMWSQT